MGGPLSLGKALLQKAPGTDGRHQIEAKRSGFDLERRSKGAAE